MPKVMTLRLTQQQYSDLANSASALGLSMNAYCLLKLLDIVPSKGNLRGKRSKAIKESSVSTVVETDDADKAG